MVNFAGSVSHCPGRAVEGSVRRRAGTSPQVAGVWFPCRIVSGNPGEPGARFHRVSGTVTRDPPVLTGVVLAMALLGFVATWIPAQRALSIDPAILLREE